MSISRLEESINYAHSLGLKIVIGDGLGSEINCWMEAKIANGLIENAGEYNGFLKIKHEARILSNSIKFQNGFFITSNNWKLEIDRDKLEKYCVNKEIVY